MNETAATPEPMRSQGPRGVAVLGSTGSIGVSTLDVIARHPQRFRVTALSAYAQVDRLFEQCSRVRPRHVVMVDEQAAAQMRRRLAVAGLSTKVHAGAAALTEIVRERDVDIVMAAIVGAAGLLPTLAAVRAGKRVLLANKEPLVMSGSILIREAQRAGAELLPIDSEHNAIFQCMPAGYAPGANHGAVRRILLTCSGGPFRTTTAAELAHVTPEQACAHPKWVMGRKISVDSATLMNKGLELIEACRLFGVTPQQVEILIHRQSVVHSLVEYADGSVLAQLGNPDMRTPIAHALAWPERIESGVKSLDLIEIGRLDFEPPDLERFPCLRLAHQAALAGGTAPAILNAANEVAVASFLARGIRFNHIPAVIERTLTEIHHHADSELELVLADDARARAHAATIVEALQSEPTRNLQ